MSLFAVEILAILLGLLFGSFLNVCISRLPPHESIVKPRSRCPRCGHTIRWYDNIPILSWFFLRARCRDCRTCIPWRYPLVELLTAGWFLLTARIAYSEATRIYDFALDLNAITRNAVFDGLTLGILGFLLLGLLVMDWQTQKLPDAFTITGTILGFLLICTRAIFLSPGEADIRLNPHNSLRMSSPGSFVARGNVFLTGPEHLVFGRLLAIIAAALIPLLIRWTYRAIRGQDGLGLGDVKLLGMIAAFLGFWPALFSMILGCTLVLPYALFLLATRRANRSTQLPFGTFLCAGGLLSALFSEPAINWYRSLF